MAQRRLALLLLLGVVGCGRHGGDGDKAQAGAAKPELTMVTAQRNDLLFRYKADDGSYATATSVAEVPEAARGAVQVVDLSRSPDDRDAAKFVEVFDLRQAGPDGRFPGKLVPRAELEQALAERAAVPKQQPVIVYSASWCGVCHKAKEFLKKEGIAFVDKDVEKDPGVAEELAQKARAQGVSTNGVPVFDVGGRLINGFDPDSLLQAIRSPHG
jgi:glutaredoxin